MDENILQKCLPESFKKNAAIKQLPTHDIYSYTWHYQEARELLEWLQLDKFIIDTIQVFSPVSSEMNYLGHSWHYHGNRNKAKQENIDANFSEALKFLESVHSKTNMNIVYEIFFRSEKDMDEITRDYFYKSILHSGYNYEMPEALEIIERYKKIGKKISVVEVYEIKDSHIQPIDMRYYTGSGYENYDPIRYFEKYHIEKNADNGHWKEAMQYIKDLALTGYYFQIFVK